MRALTSTRGRFEQRLAAPPEDVFAFFADARNLEAITPPLLRFRRPTPDALLRDGRRHVPAARAAIPRRARSPA